jgi:hypothetical protein
MVAHPVGVAADIDDVAVVELPYQSAHPWSCCGDDERLELCGHPHFHRSSQRENFLQLPM